MCRELVLHNKAPLWNESSQVQFLLYISIQGVQNKLFLKFNLVLKREIEV